MDANFGIPGLPVLIIVVVVIIGVWEILKLVF